MLNNLRSTKGEFMKPTKPSSNINPSAPTRQQNLVDSIAQSGLTYTELGRRLKISIAAARKLCLAETVPPGRRFQMEAVFNEYGIDAALLPPGLHIPLGFSRKHILGEKSPA